MNLQSRQGQVTTEYILLAAFVISLLVAISGLLNSFVQQAGQEIETKASEVISQRQMGIPLSWFFNKPSGSLPDAGSPDAGVGRGLSGGGPGSGPGGGSGLTAGGGDNGATNDGSSPGAGAGVTNAGLTAGNTGGIGGSGAGASGAGNGGDSASAEEEADKDAVQRAGGRGTTGGVVEVDDGESSSVRDRKKKEEAAKKDEESDKKSGLGADGAQRREYALTNEADRRKGSCEDFDLFRLLKILAIVALVVLGGAYLMSASGNRGSHKK